MLETKILSSLGKVFPKEIRGREKALELIDKHFGEMSLNYCTFDEKILLNFRKELNSLLK